MSFDELSHRRTVVQQNIGNTKTVLSNATTTFEQKGEPKRVRTDVRLPTFQSVCQTAQVNCRLIAAFTRQSYLVPATDDVRVLSTLEYSQCQSQAPGHNSCYQIFRDKLQATMIVTFPARPSRLKLQYSDLLAMLVQLTTSLSVTNNAVGTDSTM